MNSDQQNRGLQASLIDRSRRPPSRLGITPQAIDDTLYDAFGQRQVSTMYTPLNQYHVVMEVDAAVLAESRRRCSTSTCAAPSGAQVPLSAFTRYATDDHAAGGQSPGPVSGGDDLVQPAAGRRRWATRSTAIEDGRARDRPAGDDPRQLPGHGAGVQASLANQPLLILAALVTVYIVLGMLYESYIHPITILSTLPSAGVGALLALMLCHTELTSSRSSASSC